ncbi:MAG: apolipoprotein N-acyltransferase, partial [Alphaproteobacteria bacterium]
AEVNPFRVWNSLFVLDGGGDVIGVYDKTHLVPFGEYVPLRQFLPMPKITEGAVDFSAGDGPQTLTAPGLPPFSPLICYEAIFPGNVASRKDRPAWLLNITNDSWFGRSAGPYQHFASTRWRAVEEGLPMVRAAAGGISAVVDPYGRVVAELGLGRRGVLDTPLPEALSAPFFTRGGSVLPWLLALLSLIFGGILSRYG